MSLVTRQRKELAMDADKENAEQQNKMPSVDVLARKIVSPKVKLRKNSDNCDDKLLMRGKGLQVTSTNTVNNVLKKRIQSSSESSTAKSFVKTRFFVYDDGKSDGHTVEKHSSLKLRETEKSTKSIYHAKCVPSALAVVEKPRGDEKLSAATTESKKSPKNLPLIIPKSDVCKIKEKHRKSMTRKSMKVAYDVLSLELAYNIEYMKEYIRYQMEMNEKKKLSSSFLRRGVTVNQRRLVVKYLINSTTYYKSPSFILYQAVKIYDAYIDKVDVSLLEMQIVALAALWIAFKKDLMIDDVPEAAMIMKLAATTSKNDPKPLFECEKKILMSLQFEVNFPDPFSMLALYSIMVEEVRELESSQIQQLYYCGSYLMDLSMLDNDLCDVLAVHLAEICAEIALVVMMTSSDNLREANWNHWHTRVIQSNSILEKYILPDNKVSYIRNQLVQKVVLSRDKDRDYYAVYKKYCTKRYGAISVFLTSKISSLFVSRITDPSYVNRPIIF